MNAKGAVDLYLAICREHGVLDVGLEGRYIADRRIDRHREERDCESRIVRITHERWEQLKKAGILREEISQAAPAELGP